MNLVKLVNLSRLAVEKQERFLKTHYSRKKTLIEIAHVSEKTFEKMYQAAKQLYNEKQYEQAVNGFGFLILINSQSYSSWLGLANSQFFLKHYEEGTFCLCLLLRTKS